MPQQHEQRSATSMTAPVRLQYSCDYENDNYDGYWLLCWTSFASRMFKPSIPLVCATNKYNFVNLFDAFPLHLKNWSALYSVPVLDLTETLLQYTYSAFNTKDSYITWILLKRQIFWWIFLYNKTGFIIQKDWLHLILHMPLKHQKVVSGLKFPWSSL